MDDAVFGSRVRFDLKSQTTGLVLDPVLPEDSGLYRCRVDYKASPTRNERIQLEVIVGPKRVFITNDVGLEVSGVIGPYTLGASVSLTCHVEGGHPLPKITWRRKPNNELTTSKVVSSTMGQRTSTLILNRLAREDLYLLITCYASNSNLMPPMSTSVTLDITFPPLEANLHQSEKDFKEGTPASITCEAIGSRPAANITWWKNGKRIDKSSNEVFDKGNFMRSTLTFTPTLEDDSAQLICRARNPIVPMAVIETSTKIKVLYSPRLRLFAGRSLNLEDIKEGDDVYFECEIRANPKATPVKWFLNGKELFQRIESGVILSNQSLVLQKVKRSFAGDLRCSATNSEGTGLSNVLTLRVKYAPLCDPRRQHSYGVEQNETIHVSCNVVSNPEPRKFRWAFNTSSELLDLSWVKGQSKKQLKYVPKSDLDYGSLLCWAENEIGLQDIPCVYHVIKSSVPGPVKNCSVMNVTSTSAFIFCLPGWNGGLEQFFSLHVHNGSLAQRDNVALQVSDYSSMIQGRAREASSGGENPPLPLAKASPASKPNFFLTGLKENTRYIVLVSASNRKGKSRPFKVPFRTVGDAAEKRVGMTREAGASSNDDFGYLPLAIFSSSLAILLLLFLVVVIVLKMRDTHHYSRETKGVTLNFALEKKVERAENSSDSSSSSPRNKDERTPDIIPCGGDSSEGELRSSSNFRQLKHSFKDDDIAQDEFYVVENYAHQRQTTPEKDTAFKLKHSISEFSSPSDALFDNRSSRALTEHRQSQFQEVKSSLHQLLSDQSPSSSADLRPAYPVGDARLSLYNDSLIVVNPSACESLPKRTHVDEKENHSGGLSNIALTMTNLETFLNENQLESSV